jgi:excisionase family DNA binding protein
MADGSRERPQLEDLPDVMSAHQHVAPFLGVSGNTVYGAIRSGLLPAVRVGRRILIAKAALLRWLEQGWGERGGDD